MFGKLILLAVALMATAVADASCGRGWVFFDLGNTLINTSDWDHLRYLSEAKAYLHRLKSAGYQLGMITNIPESWGLTEAEKIATLQAEINRTWAEPEAFDWALFDVILVPPSDQLRKPAPYLFNKGRTLAEDCSAVYQGEDPREIDAARAAGMDGYLVGGTPGEFFKPLEL